MLDVYKLMGIEKTNTTAYHPQTDGLVERFNRTPTDMLAKCVENNGKDWDQAYNIQQGRVLSICCMGETHVYQLMRHLACPQIEG